jgi:hypothetical protein
MKDSVKIANVPTEIQTVDLLDKSRALPPDQSAEWKICYAIPQNHYPNDSSPQYAFKPYAKRNWHYMSCEKSFLNDHG